jgi:hypothetical protein
MIKNFKRRFSGDYGVKLIPNKLKFLCEVDWPAFGVGWPLEGPLDKTVVNEAKIGLQKSHSVVYFNSDSNSLGELKRNQSLSVLMGSFGAPVCTSSTKMGILKED